MKIIKQLKTQKETLEMARLISEQHAPKPTFLENALSVIAALIFYGVGIGFGVYMIFGFFTQ